MLAVAVLLFWLTATPFALGWSERHLAVHHTFHWLQFAAGAVFAAGWARRPNLGSMVAAGATTVALAYVMVVHLPFAIDVAVDHPVLHLALHAGFSLAGAVLAFSWSSLGAVARALFVVIAMAVMTLLSLAEITGAFAYSAYPPSQVATSGLVMLLGMAVFWIALALAGLPGRLPARVRRPLAWGLVAVLVAALVASYLAG